MAIELEASLVGDALHAVEMLFEIGDPLFGIELHRRFQVPHHLPFIPPPSAKHKCLLIARPDGCS